MTAVVAASYVAGASAIVSDSFTRANSATSLGTADTGQAWVPLSDTWGITSNTAYKVTASNQGYVVIDSGVSDCTITVTVSGTTTAGGGITFRATDVSNLWFVECGSGASSVYKSQTGSGLTQMASGWAAFAAGDVMSVVLSGTSINVKKNGTSIGTLTNAFNQTATKHGLRDYTGTIRLDDFSVT